MKKLGLLLVVLVLAGGLASCSKKSKPASEKNLNPANAIQKYGGVMGKTYQKAKSLDAVLPVKHALESFHAMEGRYPSSLEELVEKGYLKEVPQPPEGLQFKYNPETGSIRLE